MARILLAAKLSSYEPFDPDLINVWVCLAALNEVEHCPPRMKPNPNAVKMIELQLEDLVCFGDWPQC